MRSRVVTCAFLEVSSLVQLARTQGAAPPSSTASSFMEAGLRVKGVRIPGDLSDTFQSSLEPYVRGLFERAFVGAGFLFNLDEPLGPFLDTGSIWGFRVEGGARF